MPINKPYTDCCRPGLPTFSKLRATSWYIFMRRATQGTFGVALHWVCSKCGHTAITAPEIERLCIALSLLWKLFILWQIFDVVDCWLHSLFIHCFFTGVCHKRALRSLVNDLNQKKGKSKKIYGTMSLDDAPALTASLLRAEDFYSTSWSIASRIVGRGLLTFLNFTSSFASQYIVCIHLCVVIVFKTYFKQYMNVSWQNTTISSATPPAVSVTSIFVWANNLRLLQWQTVQCSFETPL